MSVRVSRRIDNDTKLQFGLIQEIAAILGQARIRIWLRGGWALDFLQGEITRSHADIDLVTWKRHAGRVRELLSSHGYHPLKATNPAAQINFSKDGQKVGVVFIMRERRGRIITQGFEHWPWPRGAFTDLSARIGSVVCRVINPVALAEEKEKYFHHTGRRLRPKDRESLRRLRQLLSRGR